MGCPIRRSRDQSLFSAPPSLSQSITSFIASCCQGIHQTPFSRLIRSRRRQETVATHCIVRAGSSAASLFWIRSHTFSRLDLRPDYEQQSLLGLVYLTWTTLILCEEANGRKAWRPSQPLGPKATSTSRSAHLRGEMRLIDISLYDVKSCSRRKQPIVRLDGQEPNLVLADLIGTLCLEYVKWWSLGGSNS